MLPLSLLVREHVLYLVSSSETVFPLVSLVPCLSVVILPALASRTRLDRGVFLLH
nr:hypothetical protein [Kibdelosporangium sp. MJ126-NF4]CTQ89775.1 hypothetical protein [Kibdelosporangium sp. MJ126-NF4]